MRNLNPASHVRRRYTSGGYRCPIYSNVSWEFAHPAQFDGLPTTQGG